MTCTISARSLASSPGSTTWTVSWVRTTFTNQDFINFVSGVRGRRFSGYHITYDDLKKMADEKNKRYGQYAKEDEEGLDKIN